MKERIYAAIDLKSFYASVECMDRGLDPLTTNLVVADSARTEKTICLAVTPSLKAYGISGRARLFEVVEQVKQANALRQTKAPGRRFTGTSCQSRELENHPEWGIDYLVAPPRMKRYMQVSSQIYGIYLKYVAPEDIHIYSVDEVFIDVTPYLRMWKMTAYEFVRRMIADVLETTGITATAGIGTNLYLCKIAMDIVAKKTAPDEKGVRIASLTEQSYRELLWDHRPLTDFWRVGRGYARRLEKCGLYTMGDIARCSLGKPGEFYNEDLLYKLFGVNAQLLIDHAWGWESCTIAQIKNYKPQSKSLCTGQVLTCPYTFQKTALIIREMVDGLTLDLVEKGLVTDQLTLTVGYDIENLKDPAIAKSYKGETVTDPYGRKIPKHSHGTVNLPEPTASTRQIMEAVGELFQRIGNPDLLVRRLQITACRLKGENEAGEYQEQLDFFGENLQRQQRLAQAKREKQRQKAVLTIKHRYGKNAIFRGMDLLEGATALERNRQVGGHRG